MTDPGCRRLRIGGRQHGASRGREGCSDPAWSKTPRTYTSLASRNREIPSLAWEKWHPGPRCESNEHDSDVRRREVGQAHSTEEVGEQSARCVGRGGVGGGKGPDQGESGRAKQVPDTEPEPE